MFCELCQRGYLVSRIFVLLFLIFTFFLLKREMYNYVRFSEKLNNLVFGPNFKNCNLEKQEKLDRNKSPMDDHYFEVGYIFL